jgi:hypothetical protein
MLDDGVGHGDRAARATIAAAGAAPSAGGGMFGSMRSLLLVGVPFPRAKP